MRADGQSGCARGLQQFLEDVFHGLRGGLLLEVGNGERAHRAAVLHHRRGDIGHRIDDVARLGGVTARAQLRQQLQQFLALQRGFVARNQVQPAIAYLVFLESEQHVAGGGLGHWAAMAHAHHQRHFAGWIHARHHHDLLARRHHQMAGLAADIGKPVHHRHGRFDGAFHRRLFHAQPEQAWRDRIADVAFAARDVVALFQHLQHAEDLAARAPDTFGNFRDTQRAFRAGQQLQNVQALVQRGCAVFGGHVRHGFSVPDGHRLQTLIGVPARLCSVACCGASCSIHE